MQNQLLLIEDVDDLGRSGDVVKVKPGYARNFLLPQKKAVVADPYTLRLQAKLKEERMKQAAVDKKDAEALAARLEGMILTTEVKVDPDGHMYGSVSAVDIVHLFEKEGIQLERRNVILIHPFKQLGEYPVQLKLKEGIPATVTLHIVPEVVNA
ncbi:MAG: ribosomal protein [Chlamydiota bacterium]|jgi:large subunit ribosomal protein L9